jgi:hypothetical protein
MVAMLASPDEAQPLDSHSLIMREGYVRDCVADVFMTVVVGDDAVESSAPFTKYVPS